MSAKRRRDFEYICALAGDPPVHINNVGEGWPGIATILTDLGPVRTAMHVSEVSPHSRADYEWRFQNPANRSPVVAPRGTMPLLVGFDRERDVLVAIDGRSRVGREKRFSLLFNVSILGNAARDGWAEYISDTSERIVALHPKLLPIFVQAVRAGAWPDPSALIGAAAASGVTEEDDEPAADRARAMGSRLVRSAVFSRDVRKAYRHRCAMCGLGLELVQGAHIYPASAERSPDKVWNGMALCHNHHGAFDKHLIWVHPTSHRIDIHPDVLDTAKRDTTANNFVNNTRSELWVPSTAREKPRRDMFEKRYDFYGGAYDWK